MEANVPGFRIGNELLGFVKESERIRPLRDGIIVEPLNWQPSHSSLSPIEAKLLEDEYWEWDPGKASEAI